MPCESFQNGRTYCNKFQLFSLESTDIFKAIVGGVLPEMSCRPTVPQATRSYVVRRLDDADQELTLLKKARGYDLLDKVSEILQCFHHCRPCVDNSIRFLQVCKSLGLLEKEYFGLCYQDKTGDWLWVNLRNPLSEQVPQGNRVVIEMRVKYFISPHKILQPVTR